MNLNEEMVKTMECLYFIRQACNIISETCTRNMQFLRDFGHLDPSQVIDHYRFLERRMEWYKENAQYSYCED